MFSPSMLVVPLAVALLVAPVPLPPLAPPLTGGVALAGPPWISIEYPANPLDRTTRGAYLLVHAFHHGTPVGLPVRGTAEGIVDGQRRTVQLDFATTSRAGVYALSRQWPTDGHWLLVISVAQEGMEHGATALVRVAPTGEIAAVEVPSREQDGWTIPLPVTRRDIETALASHARGTTDGSLARQP